MAEGSSFFGKLGKSLALTGALAGGGGAAAGYGMSDKLSLRNEYVVNAKPEKVWKVLKDPELTPRWMPQDILDIAKVETLKPHGLAKVGAFFSGGDAAEGPNDPTHRFTLRDGQTIDIRAEYEEDAQAFRETVTSPATGMEKYFTSFSWGFEMQKVAGEENQTRVVVVRRAKAKRPFGVLLVLYRKLSGKHTSDAKRIIEGVERVARD